MLYLYPDNTEEREEIERRELKAVFFDHKSIPGCIVPVKDDIFVWDTSRKRAVYNTSAYDIPRGCTVMLRPLLIPEVIKRRMPKDITKTVAKAFSVLKEKYDRDREGCKNLVMFFRRFIITKMPENGGALIFIASISEFAE